MPVCAVNRNCGANHTNDVLGLVCCEPLSTHLSQSLCEYPWIGYRLGSQLFPWPGSHKPRQFLRGEACEKNMTARCAMQRRPLPCLELQGQWRWPHDACYVLDLG